MELLDKYHEAIRDLRYVRDRLHSLSDSFAEVGNDHISLQLSAYANDIDRSIEPINRYTDSQLSNLVQSGFDSSYRMLQSTLAGIKIGREEGK